MKKDLVTIILFTVYSLLLNAQSQDLNLLLIPDSLRINANAVIRYDHTDIEIQSFSKMIVRKNVAVTVLNKYGDEDGHIYLNYDHHKKIRTVGAKILDFTGKEIKKIKKSDFSDVSAVDGGTLFSDDRVLYYEHQPSSYPYTIVYEYETSTSNTAFIRTWYPIKFYGASTEESTYSITYPEDIKIFNKDVNLEKYKLEKNSERGRFFYSLKNAPAIKYELMSPVFNEFGPHVKFAANKFQLGGEAGGANDWAEFGKWWYDNFINGRNELSEATKTAIQQLVKGSIDPRKRAELVYKYMQDKTRYISIQIGIGGWKPMTAMEVDELGYGDCKGLSNYTMALLEEADVTSYYSKIYAGEGERVNLDPKIAFQHSNHVILMVPFEKDTVWLECTNQKIPFGHLGSFTDDRDALVVTPEGGKVVRTRKYTSENNSQDIKGELNIDNNGKIKADIFIESSGIQYDDHYGIAFLDENEKDTYYNSFFDEINNVNIQKIEIENNEKDITFTEHIQFSADNFAVNSGEKMLVRLNMVNTSQHIPKRIRNRKLPLEIKYGFIDTDDVIINLPENYKIEAIGEPSTLKTPFGSYSIQIQKINEKQLNYKRTLLINQGLYSVADYDAYRKFRKKINQLDHLKIVLTKSL